MLSFPTGLSMDAARRQLFIADQGNHVVRRLDLTTGLITSFMGKLGHVGAIGPAAWAPGAGDYSSTRDVRLRRPTDVIVDPLHRRLYVADSANVALRAVDLDDEVAWSVFARSGPVTARDGGPTHLAIDSGSGTLFISELYTHAVRAMALQPPSSRITCPGQHAPRAPLPAPPRGPPVTFCAVKNGIDSTCDTWTTLDAKMCTEGSLGGSPECQPPYVEGI